MHDLQQEEWRDVPGWEGRVQASNLGRIRTKSQLTEHQGWYLRKPELSGKRGPKLAVSLAKRPQDKGQRRFGIHALVALAWLGPRPEMSIIRHLNGKPFDNRAVNLAYGTPEENHLDVRIHQTQKGENNGAAKLSERDVNIIRSLLRDNVPLTVIGTAFGVRGATIWCIKHGKSWKDDLLMVQSE